MRIDSSFIMMQGQRSLEVEHTQKESLRIWNVRPTEISGPPQDRLEVSLTDPASYSQAISKNPEFGQISCKDRLMILILEKLLGIKIKIAVGVEVEEDASQIETSDSKAIETEPNWGMSYEYSETYYEKESLSFSVNGLVKTKDGQEISINIELFMSREFATVHNINIRAGSQELVDPLVINYSGNAAELTDKNFRFDIDSNGNLDLLPMLRSGSGFLALDTNGDGIINNGSELFGPNTGNGFKELAAHDSDKNGWIDESDPVYQNLRIWSKDENGNDILFALGELGVGAIYLGNLNLDYQYKNPSNELLGINTRTGLFLKEDGTPGTVQQIDLNVLPDTVSPADD